MATRAQLQDALDVMSIDEIIAWEQGDLDDMATVRMFQKGINGGLVWQLQGCYGRTAASLLEAGLCTSADTADLTDEEVADRLEALQ